MACFDCSGSSQRTPTCIAIASLLPRQAASGCPSSANRARSRTTRISGQSRSTVTGLRRAYRERPSPDCVRSGSPTRAVPRRVSAIRRSRDPFDLPAPAVRSGAGLDMAAAVTQSRYVTAADQAVKASDAGIFSSSSATLLDGNLPGVLVGMFGLGVLLAFTPCVLPMMPILSGVLVRSGTGLTAERGFLLSSTYVLGMAMAYASLGLAAAWLGRNLQVALQTPTALGLMAMALVGLSLSMFGLFDIQAPRWWRDRAGSYAGDWVTTVS